MALSLLTPPRALRYVSASLAAALDRALFSPTHAFPPAVLIELSGLAIAQIVAREYPRHTYPCVLVAAGPGNQGADGLAAARHLRTWGWKIAVWGPRLKGDSEQLATQLSHFDVHFLDSDAQAFEDYLEHADVVLDTLFGFSFQGPAREPYAEILRLLSSESRIEFAFRRPRPPIVSVDIPSGWPVDASSSSASASSSSSSSAAASSDGLAPPGCFTPQVLISLSAPKTGVRALVSQPSAALAPPQQPAQQPRAQHAHAQQPLKHYLAGRFIPPALEAELGLALPLYEGTQGWLDVTGWPEMSEEEAKALHAEAKKRQEELEEQGVRDAEMAEMQAEQEDEEAQGADEEEDAKTVKADA
ncbi:YjeF N-terminal domain-like protein [Tilletiopsis washingtonensis]|uniref:NAD(P)H-hydrate epimerase n=1 Tax=Tilletiopsis washingtonensis TaxID=58919 RepID=A0A316Z4E7_9BASI|nr:YjeF N-terminal domain-like protein [Tilletiopsis washingtonensis]PWN95075.1 YjeF N-terminal domain-like protein [Tilletiopsis washingtonensis]